MKSVSYERLFLLNRHLEEVAAILEQFRQDEVIHAIYAADRQRSVEELRADLSHVLTGMLHQKELEVCVKAVRTQPQPKDE
jgi:truncated hemoglobin YjbI